MLTLSPDRIALGGMRARPLAIGSPRSKELLELGLKGTSSYLERPAQLEFD